MPNKANKQNNWRKRDPEFAREKKRYAHPVPSRSFIIDELDALGVPMSKKKLLGHFDLHDDKERDAFLHRLGAMLRDGQLVENRKGGLGPLERMDLIRGWVQGHRNGFGFLIPDAGGDDVFLNPRQMRALMHGDRIVVRVVGKDRKGRPEGRIVDVLERAHTHIVGRYERERGIGKVIPDHPRIAQDVLVPEGSDNGAKPGQIVNVELIRQPDKRAQPMGKVAEILGDYMDPGMEIDIAVRAHGIPNQWPQAALDEASGFGDAVSEADKTGRVDLRELPLVTIDGADARDFDDAVYCKRDGKGFRLWVAIADVSAYVHPDSALDDEAQNRATSVYFPEHVVPMLPQALSNGLCSLNPEVDRLTLVCEMQIDAQGTTREATFYPAVMRSHARLTYTEVAALLADPDAAKAGQRAHVLGQLQDLQTVFEILFKQRGTRGAIDFESSETRIVFNADRKIDRIEPVERTVAHRMIEECMIAANVAAASYLAEHKMPLLYRVHARPGADALAQLREFLAGRGLTLRGGDDPEPADFARLLDIAAQRDDAKLVQAVLLRSLSRAVYSPDNAGHFGLALSHYAHFTSPIRRYPDLLVHRAIKHAQAGGKPDQFDYSPADMGRLGVSCSAAEQRADEATRDVDDWLKCEYLQDHIGEQFDGTVTGVTPFGLFVELDGIQASGLVHVSSLHNDYYHHDAAAQCLRGERSGTVHKLADRISVTVARVDLDERKIDFEPLPASGIRSKSGGQRKRRKS